MFKANKLMVAETITLYSASVLDLATTCFLLFYKIKLSPIKTQYLEVDLLAGKDFVQSASK